ncbi:calcium-binding protein [Shimia sp. SDUM112013]|uniref:calcium-binding protein n=1 Tax=Shimia sp. SDUM112013 TaxID=3136160 RepID=UPI0032EF7733
MTTYTFAGTMVSFGDNDRITAVEQAEATVVFFDGTESALTYSIGDAIPQNLPLIYLGLSDIASFEVTDLGRLGRSPGVFNDFNIGWIRWQGNTSYVFRITNYNVDKIWYFELGGDPLPQLTTITQANFFNRVVTAGGAASENSGFGPGEDILLSSIPNRSASTEDDVFVASHNGGDYETGIGDDTMIYYGDIVRYDGGEGHDTLLFRDMRELSDYTLTLEDGGAITIARGRWTAVTIENVETIQFEELDLWGSQIVEYSFDELRQLASNPAIDQNGTDDDDLLQGDNNDDRLAGLAGNDTIYGGDGRDTLNGGDGDDQIAGGATSDDLRDIIYAGAGDDRADGSYGNDLLFGMDGNDTLLGGFGSDDLRGQNGNDELSGGALSDALSGGDGEDFLNGGFGYDRMNGGTGADRFYHLGIRDHGSDWVQDYSDADGDVLVFGQSGATQNDFLVSFANTPGAGQSDIEEAFITHRPTGHIVWALIDGADLDSLTVQVTGSASFDLLA